MKANARIRFPKKSKSKHQSKPQPITQDDFYLEAIDLEEQAERWLLSDIKKSLRGYLRAYEMYEMGLTQGTEPNDKCSYNILYNETRLLLQLYSDYMANNGYINILQYLSLDDIPGVENVLIPLGDIIDRFEIVLQKYEKVEGIDTWDLQSNLLLSYLSLMENYDKYELTGDQIFSLVNKFVTLSHNLIVYQIDAIQNSNMINQEMITENSDDSSLIKDELTGANNNNNNNRDGSGVAVNQTLDGSQDQGEMMEVSDEVTPESLVDVLVNCLKFQQSILEILVESKFDQTSNIFNDIQINYLEDLIKKQVSCLNDVVTTHAALIEDRSSVDLVNYAINGIQILYTNSNETELKIYLNNGSPETMNLVDSNLVKIDILDLALNCLSDMNDDIIKWKLCTTLNQILTATRITLTQQRQMIMTSHDQVEIAQLSNKVFQLCDVTITASNNEMQRYEIKSRSLAVSPVGQQESIIKTQTILLKNARTLLTNAQTIAEKSCGMQETIVDKLKRNYIYNEAKNRLASLPQ